MPLLFSIGRSGRKGVWFCFCYVTNSCPDENRVRVVSGNHIGRIVSLLGDDTTLAFVIPVLYNICVDFSKADCSCT